MLCYFFVSISFTKIILLLFINFFSLKLFLFFHVPECSVFGFYRRPGMTHTVLLHCPISAEIRTVDSQLDLRILFYL